MENGFGVLRNKSSLRCLPIKVKQSQRHSECRLSDLLRVLLFTIFFLSASMQFAMARKKDDGGWSPSIQDVTTRIKRSALPPVRVELGMMNIE